MGKVKVMIFAKLIEILLGMFSPDIFRKFADMVLDFVENKIEESGPEWDNAIILPLCNMIRETFDIPDND